MNEDQLTRASSAIKEDMDIEVQDDGMYLVKGEYEVDPKALTCDCPDHMYRNNTCKHIIRVRLEIMWGNIRGPDEDEKVYRPVSLVPIYDNIPESLKEMNQWVCWEYKRDTVETHEKDWTKVPIDVDGGFASSTDSDTWSSYEEAYDHDAHNTYDRTDGIGIVVSKDDDLIGIDIDDCRDADTGEIDPAVEELLESVESYTEVSPSGTGLRVFVRSEDGWPVAENQTDAIAGDGVELEVYEWGRYLTVTGYHVEGTPTEVRYSPETVDLFASIMDPDYESEE